MLHSLVPSIDTQKKHQEAHEYIQKQLRKVYQAYEQNGIRTVVLSVLWRNNHNKLSNNLSRRPSNHHLYSRAHQKDFIVGSPYSHIHPHIEDFSPYEPTFYR